MYNKLISYLKSYKKATITLTELENLFSGNSDYIILVNTITELVNNDILVEKNIKSTNGKQPPLLNKYGVNKYKLREDHINEIQKYSLKISREIDLEQYFTLSEKRFQEDLPYIEMINEYIINNGLPQEIATPPERSFDITGDEKWIDQKSGKTILNNLKLWDKLKIVTNSDPLMISVNPNKMVKSDEYYHLIVENKATFLALIDVLPDTCFTSLIFGSGWKIVSNIVMLQRQLNLKGNHILYYFGDLDNEGISIWNSLNEKTSAKLAVKFYSALLTKDFSYGKETQQKNQKALNNFLKSVNDLEKQKIISILNCGGYIPQEALTKEELGNIWRSFPWI